MPTDNVTVAAVQDQIAKIAGNIASAQKEHAALALSLVAGTYAGDPKIGNAQLGEIEDEVEGYKQNIARLQAAEAEAKRNNTHAAKAARFKQLTAQRARLAKTNAETEEIAAKLEAAFGDLGLLLAQLQRAVEDRYADAHAVLAGTRGKDFHAQSEDNVARLARFDTGEVIESLANLVANSGIGRTSVVPLAPYVIVTEPNQISKKHKLPDAVAKANAKLLSALDGRLADTKKVLLG